MNHYFLTLLIRSGLLKGSGGVGCYVLSIGTVRASLSSEQWNCELVGLLHGYICDSRHATRHGYCG